MAQAIRIPTFNAIITLAVTLLALLFILRFLPEQAKQWFRV